jgi:hypothetical protein
MDDKDWIAKALEDPSRQSKHFAPPEGVIPYPLTGYTAATLSATGALLTLEFLVPPPESGTRLLRLGMTRTQCSELGDALHRLAVMTHNPNAAKN